MLSVQTENCSFTMRRITKLIILSISTIFLTIVFNELFLNEFFLNYYTFSQVRQKLIL